MSDKTDIEWTDATWNPVTGCTEVSDGCTHCYAKTFAERWRGTPGHYFERGFDVQLRPDKRDQPLRWKKPRKIFVNSMSDLFHDQVPDEYIAKVFAVMASAPQHTFQLLTKRHGRMRSLLTADYFRTEVLCQTAALAEDHGDRGGRYMPYWPLPNVWLGVSAENALWAKIRGDALRETPAAVRFFSCEPLLGPIGDLDLTGIDWVIVGGESGPGARPMHPDWARSLRDQCTAVGVPFLFKQHGEWIEDVTVHPANPAIGIDEPYRVLNIPSDAKDRRRCAMHLSGRTALTPDNPFHPFRAGHGGWTAMRRVGKHAAGRVLDGRTWDEYPVVARA